MNANNIFAIDLNAMINTGDKLINPKITKNNAVNIISLNESSTEETFDHKDYFDDVHPDIEYNQDKATLQDLPTEMIEAILTYLYPTDTIACSAVCQHWYDLFDNATIWRQYCLKNQWTPLYNFQEPCVLNSDVDRRHFSPWKECFLIHSRIRNNWMEGK